MTTGYNQSTHSIALRVWAQRVLSSQHARGDENTDEDDVTEKAVVADPVAEDTKPRERTWEEDALLLLSLHYQWDIIGGLTSLLPSVICLLPNLEFP